VLIAKASNKQIWKKMGTEERRRKRKEDQKENK
jgi:hypothetical protein